MSPQSAPPKLISVPNFQVPQSVLEYWDYQVSQRIIDIERQGSILFVTGSLAKSATLVSSLLILVAAGASATPLSVLSLFPLVGNLILNALDRTVSAQISPIPFSHFSLKMVLSLAVSGAMAIAKPAAHEVAQSNPVDSTAPDSFYEEDDSFVDLGVVANLKELDRAEYAILCAFPEASAKLLALFYLNQVRGFSKKDPWDCFRTSVKHLVRLIKKSTRRSDCFDVDKIGFVPASSTAILSDWLKVLPGFPSLEDYPAHPSHLFMEDGATIPLEAVPVASKSPFEGCESTSDSVQKSVSTAGQPSSAAPYEVHQALPESTAVEVAIPVANPSPVTIPAPVIAKAEVIKEVSKPVYKTLANESLDSLPKIYPQVKNTVSSSKLHPALRPYLNEDGSYDYIRAYIIEIIKNLNDVFYSLIIVGASGSGKGMVLFQYLALARTVEPSTDIYAWNRKGVGHELHRWDGIHPDKLINGATDPEQIAKFLKIWDEFYQVFLSRLKCQDRDVKPHDFSPVIFVLDELDLCVDACEKFLPPPPKKSGEVWVIDRIKKEIGEIIKQGRCVNVSLVATLHSANCGIIPLNHTEKASCRYIATAFGLQTNAVLAAVLAGTLPLSCLGNFEISEIREALSLCTMAAMDKSPYPLIFTNLVAVDQIYPAARISESLQIPPNPNDLEDDGLEESVNTPKMQPEPETVPVPEPETEIANNPLTRSPIILQPWDVAFLEFATPKLKLQRLKRMAVKVAKELPAVVTSGGGEFTEFRVTPDHVKTIFSSNRIAPKNKPTKTECELFTQLWYDFLQEIKGK